MPCVKNVFFRGFRDPPIKNISLSAGKFTADCTSQKSSIQSFFKQVTKEEAMNLSDAAPESHCNNYSAKFSCSSHTENQNVSKHEQKTKYRSSLDNFFKQTSVCSDNDSSRDMFLDDESAESNSIELKDQVSAKRAVVPQLDKASLLDGKASKSFKRKELSSSSERVSCPDNLENAVSHSFFARFILSYKKRKTNEVPMDVDPKPSTSKEPDIFIPQNSPSNYDTDSSDSKNANEDGDEILEKCVECGDLIPLQEFPEHVDYHSALNLQKELNENLTPPEINVAHSSVADPADSHFANSSCSKSEETPALEAEPSMDPPTEKCSYCSKLIPLQEFPEHIDYHSALDLQRELNRAPPPVVSTNASSMQVKKKKSRPHKQAPSPAKKVQTNSITSFFVPK